MTREEVLESAPVSAASMVREITKAARDQRRQQLKRESAATEVMKGERVFIQPPAKRTESAKEAPWSKLRDCDICTRLCKKEGSHGNKGSGKGGKDWDQYGKRHGNGQSFGKGWKGVCEMHIPAQVVPARVSACLPWKWPILW